MDAKKLSLAINIIFGIALVVALVAAGYYRSQYQEIKHQAPKEVIKTLKVESPEKDAEISELKKQLAEVETTILNQPFPNKVKETKPQPKKQDRWNGQRLSLVEMKAHDPERYQKIMEHYTKMNERMSSGVADKILFFNELDTTNMTEEELENHQKLLEKLAKMHEAAEQIDMNNPDEIRDNMRNQWQNYRELHELMQKERDYLLLDVGRKMGFGDAESELLRDYIKNAHDVTSGRSFWKGQGGRGRSQK